MNDVIPVPNPTNTWSLKTLKYLAIAKVAYLNNTAYFANLYGRAFIVTIRIWIFTQLYTVTYAAYQVNQVGGLTLPMVIWSLMLTQSFQSAARPHVVKLIDDEVKSGVLSYSINRPYSYLLFHYFSFLGRTFSTVFVNILIGALAVVALVGFIDLRPEGLIFGFILLFFGYALDFVMSASIGLTAFWIGDNSAFSWMYSKGQMIFGGIIIPLALFPDHLKNIAELLPFSQLFYGASRIIVSFDSQLFIKYFAVQIFWIVIMIGLSTFLFNKGLKRITINGG